MTIEQTVLQTFRELPPHKQQEVLDFIQFLKYSEHQKNLRESKDITDFWSALQDFRQRIDLENIDDDTFENLRDKSPGREVNL
ncbi:MAG: DUF2281 domain-containing protein [Nostoc sp. GBBB01]|nr:DUF2281 domain-containing protein [Nostoc sp. GBBB01]